MIGVGDSRGLGGLGKVGSALGPAGVTAPVTAVNTGRIGRSHGRNLDGAGYRPGTGPRPPSMTYR